MTASNEGIVPLLYDVSSGSESAIQHTSTYSYRFIYRDLYFYIYQILDQVIESVKSHASLTYDPHRNLPAEVRLSAQKRHTCATNNHEVDSSLLWLEKSIILLMLHV